MALRYKKVNIEVVIDEAFTDLQIESEDRNIPMLKRWATDIYNECYTPEQLIHKITLLETNNLGKVLLPSDFRKLDQVSYRIKKDKKDCTGRAVVEKWVQESYDSCGIKAEVRCDRCQKTSCDCRDFAIEANVDFSLLSNEPRYLSPTNLGVVKDSDQALGKSYLSDKFTLMGYKGNSYHRLQYHIDSCENLSCRDCKYSYAMEDGYLLTDSPAGTEILISYFGQPTDENGDIYLLDQPDLLEAVKKGILSKYFAIKMLHSREDGAFGKYKYFHESNKGESEQAIGRAISKLGTPDPNEWRAFLSDVWVKRIRDTRRTNTVINSRRK